MKNLLALIFRRLARWPKLLCLVKTLKSHTVENDKEFWALYSAAVREGVAVQPLEDYYNIYQLVKKTAKLPGDIAEVGVYRGGSAKLIASLKNGRSLHLFDTFEGMPQLSSKDRSDLGHFSDTSLESVKAYLDGFEKIQFYKGRFPDSITPGLREKQFSFVHLDVDIYDSTLAALEFFYPRMVKGGVIISHDYRNVACPGVKSAFDEFFTARSEMVTELWKTQCFVIKN